MLRFPCLLFFLLPLSNGSNDKKTGPPLPPVQSDGPAYTAEGQLKFPAQYREWIFLSSGVDMSYDPKPVVGDHSMFNNVFVNPSAYRAFLLTGTWPEGTMLMLENRAGEGHHSINTKGRTQGVEVMAMELHVKDSAHEGKDFAGGWMFYDFNNQVSAKPIAQPASCYTCHKEHAAVDTTFVQFYPTLIGISEKKSTLSDAYLKELPPTVK